MPDSVSAAPEQLVAGLVAMQQRLADEAAPVRVTWVNHFSVRGAIADAEDVMRAVEVCGVDGLLLKWILGHPQRTSADLVVPLLLRADQSIKRVLAIGGCGDRSTPLSEAMGALADRPLVVQCLDGFEDLPRGAELKKLVERFQPDLMLVGLGAGLQERVLAEGAAGMTRGYALTCGGYLDQVLQDGYYPSWAYPLRLNWLIRLLREPRRLWRRYTVDALQAVARGSELRRAMSRVPGAASHALLTAPIAETRLAG